MDLPNHGRHAGAHRLAVLFLQLALTVSINPLATQAAEYLVSDRATHRILRYDADDGSYLGDLVNDDATSNGGLFSPSAMAFGFDHDLFVTSIDFSTGDGQLLRYDASTGAFKGVFASGLLGPAGLLYHQASNTMLVGSLGAGLGDSNVIARLAADGKRLDDIVAGPISGRTGMASAPDGTVFVSSFAEEPFFNGSVLQLDYDSGTNTLGDAGVFAAAAELLGANGLSFDAEGDLYVASLLGQSVVKFDIQDDAVVGSSVLAQAAYPSGVLIGADGNLLVTSLGNNNPNDPIYPNLFPGAVFKFDTSTGAMVGGGPFLVGGTDFQPTAILSRGLAGDFDEDGQLTPNDIDLLTAAVRTGSNPAEFDLNDDRLVDDADRRVWVVDLKRTYFGDANLNGEFDSSDLIAVFAHGEYEDDIEGNSTWATGDWSGDAEFDSGDFVTALQFEGYELGPRPAVVAVPEPGMVLTLVVALPLIVRIRRRAT